MPTITKDLGKAFDVLKNGKTAVIKTDTLYGVVANALDKKAVERVYEIKGRTPSKPFLMLVPSVEFIKKHFDVQISQKEKEILQKEGITVILNLNTPKQLEYLHRGTNTLAFRIPAKQNLKDFIQRLETPLIAPSANPEGKEPAKTVQEAVDYFGNLIDIYVDEGKAEKKPSPIVKIKNNEIIYIRK
ncbi:MAG: threonylcarbamoyl-AMP synthase [Aquificae bacterium]|nr:threonylcarbamoyl-AMP synthase [Aquificota bacterium]